MHSCAPQIFPDAQLRWFEEVGYPCIEGPVYADCMELLSRIINVLAELSHLARTLLTDGVHFIAVCARPRIRPVLAESTHTTGQGS